MPPTAGTLLALSLRGSLGLASNTVVLGAVALAAIYLVVAYVFLPTGVFWSPDSGIKYLQLLNIRWDSGLQQSIAYPGQDLDPDFQFVPFTPYYRVDNGQLYGLWPPYPILLYKLAFTLLGEPGILLPSIAAGVITALGTYRLAGLVGVATRWPALAVVGLTTPLFVYSGLFWEHALFTAATTWAVVWIVTGQQQVRLRVSILGFVLLGLGLFLRPEGIVFAAAVLTACLMRVDLLRQRRIVFAAVTLVAGFSGALWAANQLFFQHALSIHGVFSLQGFIGLEYLDEAGFKALQNLLVSDNVSGGGALLFVLSAAGLVYAFLINPSRVNWAMLSCLALAYAIAALFILIQTPSFHELHGVLAASPLVLFALFPGPDSPAEAAAASLVRTAAVLFLLMGAAGFSMFASAPLLGGLEWGPRYFLPVYPLLVPLALAGFAALYARTTSTFSGILLALALVLLLISLGLQAKGLGLIREDMRHSRELARLLSGGPEVVVTNAWTLAPVTAPAFYQHQIFWVDDFQHFSRWLVKARERGVRDFSLVTLGPALYNQVSRETLPDALTPGEVRSSSRAVLFARFTLDSVP